MGKQKKEKRTGVHTLMHYNKRSAH